MRAKERNIKLTHFLTDAAGISRRKAFDAIVSGRVTVGGRTVTDPSTLVDAERDEVRLDGNLVQYIDEKVYIMLNKPPGVVTAMEDPKGRKTVGHIVDNIYPRVVPVGRLDYHTSGLLLLTNDGELSYKLTNPKYRIEKTYIAKVKGVPDRKTLSLLREGIVLDGRKTLPGRFEVIEVKRDKAWVQVTIVEGKYRQVRRMFQKVGFPVMKLRRVGFANLTLGDLPTGQWRYLTKREISLLKKYIEEREKALRPD
ncbi:MAG: rRNA pseudouridine synthase [Deltaproteobacteria bacterium]|nr:MAG: rRNA pseudouridine synthase [Deltaproteobacteria bacterium]